MTPEEFRDQFNVLYNNIMSNAAPGLNSYEVSVFLTKAQDEIIKNYFNPKGNKYQEGFDGSAKRQVDFSSLVCVYQATQPIAEGGYDPRGIIYKLPEDCMIIISEFLITDNGYRQIVPVTYDQYVELMSKPYKQPLKFQAWRLIADSDMIINVEIIKNPSDEIQEYRVRYIRKPQPIIVEDLTDDDGNHITVDGRWERTECELNPILHQEILQRAVELAKSAYIGDLQSSVQLGQRSE